MNKNNLHFFLGGRDLEMETIRDLLDKQSVAYSDANLDWGNADVLAYRNEIAETVEKGMIPVIVELRTKDKDGKSLMKLPSNIVIVDHHNENSGNDASVIQVCRLLGIEPTRYELLVAANDIGMGKAMREMGATKTEINKIRYLDRVAQGITPEQEKQAETALGNAKESGGVLFVTCEHSKTASILDRLDRDTYLNVFMYSASDGKIIFSGDGFICKKLTEKFPQPNNFSGGYGFGKKGEMAYWGSTDEDVNEVAKFVLAINHEKQTETKAFDPKSLLNQKVNIL